MKYILSIDGGGIRGIIPALLLAAIEEKSGRPISDLFQLITGTSTGAILALGLLKEGENGKPEYSAEDLVRIYQERGNEIFSRSFWKGMSSAGGLSDEKYSSEGIEAVLEDYFSHETLGNSLGKAMITSYDIQNRKPIFFKSWENEFKSVEMRYAARATSAAPTYFSPALIPVDGSMKALIDGGVFINNPSVSAYAEALKLFPGEEISVVSIGTGQMVRPIQYEEAKNWGKAGWVLPVINCMMDGVSDAANYQMKTLIGDKYYRFQIMLDDASDDMDNASKGNIRLLIEEAHKLLDANDDDINALVSRLLEGLDSND